MGGRPNWAKLQNISGTATNNALLQSGPIAVMGRILYGSMGKPSETPTSPDGDIRRFKIPTPQREEEGRRSGGVQEVPKQGQNEHQDRNDILDEWSGDRTNLDMGKGGIPRT